MGRKPLDERTHRQQAINLKEAWEVAHELDQGLSLEPPSDLTEDAVRAILTLARMVEELRHEWS